MRKLTTILLLCVFLTSVSAISLKAPQKKELWGLESAICSDSDKGKNFLMKGTVNSFDKLSRKRTHYTDACFVASNFPVKSCGGASCGVLEGYCGKGGFSSEKYTCPSGCKNGACLPTKAGGLTSCRRGCENEQKDCLKECPNNSYSRKSCITTCTLSAQSCKRDCR